MPGESPISTLRAGETVDGIFACVRKERQVSRAGGAYLTVELRDATGSMLGRAFKAADLLAGRFEAGDIVAVKGRVQRFRDELQVEIVEIAATSLPEQELSRFLPTSKRDLDELEGFLEHLVREIYDPGLRGLCERLLGNDQLKAELRRAPCAVPGESRARGGSRHHAYLGGLLEHTVAVATMALELCIVHQRLDRDLLLCSAIVHDLGRTKEFSYGASIGRTQEGEMLGHVQLGLRLIAAAAPSSLDLDRLLSLQHCVAMHHGGEGGELRFASAEAVALHRLNALDVGVKAALERGLS